MDLVSRGRIDGRIHLRAISKPSAVMDMSLVRCTCEGHWDDTVVYGVAWVIDIDDPLCKAHGKGGKCIPLYEPGPRRGWPW